MMSKNRREHIQKEIETVEKKKEFLKNQEKVLMREEKELERRARSHRLIEWGAMLKSHLSRPLILDNDQIMEILNVAFSLSGTRIVLDRMISEAEKRCVEEI